MVYENAVAREHVLQAAPQLQEAAQNNDNPWWSFELLSRKPKEASQATLRAAAADLVVFAVLPSGDLPKPIKLWIETWIAKRKREGTIVALSPRSSTHPGELPSLKEIYLRHIALGAGMDYLSRVPSSLQRAIPNSLDSYQERAHQMTSVLDEILATGFSAGLPRL